MRETSYEREYGGGYCPADLLETCEAITKTQHFRKHQNTYSKLQQIRQFANKKERRINYITMRLNEIATSNEPDNISLEDSVWSDSDFYLNALRLAHGGRWKRFEYDRIIAFFVQQSKQAGTQKDDSMLAALTLLSHPKHNTSD